MSGEPALWDWDGWLTIFEAEQEVLAEWRRNDDPRLAGVAEHWERMARLEQRRERLRDDYYALLCS